MAIRFPAAAMVVGYVSRGRGRGLFAVIIVLVVTVPSPPPYPSFDNTDTNKGQVDGRQVDLTAQVSPIAKEEISRTVSTVIELLLLRGI